MMPQSPVDDQLRDIISAMRTNITDVTKLVPLLAAPLGLFGLLPPSFRHFDILPITGTYSNKSLQLIPVIQRTLLQSVVPTWRHILAEDGPILLLEQYFLPITEQNDMISSLFAIYSYSTLVFHTPIDGYVANLLARLADLNPLHKLHGVIFGGKENDSSHFFEDLLENRGEKENLWETYVKAAFASPGRVSNALGDLAPPDALSHIRFFSGVAKSCELIIYQVSKASQDRTGRDVALQSIHTLISKLINTGLFTSSLIETELTFFNITLPTIRRRLKDPGIQGNYSRIWIAVLDTLPSMQLQKLFTALINCVQLKPVPSRADSAGKWVASNAKLLSSLIGPLSSSEDDASRWDAATGVLLERAWREELGRVLVCWVAGNENSADVTALEILLERSLDIWSNPLYIKHSSLSRHKYMTTILLLTVSHLPPSSKGLQRLAFSPPFINSMTTYLGHLDPAVRRCGMLTAEFVASRLGKKLEFGDWDGVGQGREWFRQLRTLAAQKDVLRSVEAANSDDSDGDCGTSTGRDETESQPPKKPSSPSLPTTPKKPLPVLYDSDDSLTGYASPSPSSSRGVSPSPSELEEIEKDPSLNIGQNKRPARPVYLVQLGELLVHTARGEEQRAPLKEEVALHEGAALIRRKGGYGLELEENAVNLAISFIRLQDNYDLPQFREKREAILTALVACCPKKTAPCLIEYFFIKDFNSSQRAAILNSLAFGAREIAGLSPPPNAPSEALFPSKTLPPALHQKYVTSSDAAISSAQTRYLVEGITREAVQKGRQEAEAAAPPGFARERQLRVQAKHSSSTSIVELEAQPTRPVRTSVNNTSPNLFNEIAAEYFIMPLINRFWQYLRDEQMREDRSIHSKMPYRGAGTAMILDAPTISHFLGTLTILLHASRHSPAFLAVLAPEALELAVTLGTKPMSLTPRDEDEASSEDEPAVAYGKQAQVLATALECTLIILDACWALESGKTLGLEHTVLLLGVRQWAEEIFRELDKGIQIEGIGGSGELRVKAASASVLLKLEDMASKWRHAMVEI